MEACGPFEPAPALALAVSGGADSMAMALLARDWAAARGGAVSALVVDHRLRPESATEADLTCRRLQGLGIRHRLLALEDLPRGPALAARARAARYAALTRACREAGLLHLLLGHHAADQAETLAMRVLRGSQSAGLAGMAALRETAAVRLLRPLLTVQPAELRALLGRHGVAWVEDPSNRDRRALRPRLRLRMPPNPDLPAALARAGAARVREERAAAAVLAERVSIRPEGFALLSPGRIHPAALRALLRTIAGSPYPVAPAQIAALAAQPACATLGGVRLMAAGRLGGWLVMREEAAIGGPVPARDGALWDGRFRMLAAETMPGATIDRLGGAAARFRDRSDFPAAVLRTLPAIWHHGKVQIVPHLAENTDIRMLFMPPTALAGPEFLPAASSQL